MKNGNSRILFIIDLIFILFYFFVVFAFYKGGTMIPLKGNILMVLIIFYWFFISINSDILKINRLTNNFKILKDILIAYSVLSTATIATVAIFGEFRPNDKLILYPLLYSFISCTFLRLFYLITIKQFIKFGYNQKSILIIGSGSPSKQVIEKIFAKPELGFKIHGILSDKNLDPSINELHIGGLEKFQETLCENHIDEVIIAKPIYEKNAIKHIVEKCEKHGVRFCIIPDFYNIIPKWTVVKNFGDVPVIAARNEPLNIFGNRIIKRLFDVIVSSVGLLILFPLFLIIAIAIKIAMPGPILFRQKRIGNNNIEFTLYKFRSMSIQTDKESDIIWTTRNDKRITSFGNILRRSNLDELPQLWNVFVGDMSIVGPRPERGHFVEKFSNDIPNYRIRHLVKSGITGLAQANGWRGNTSIKKRIENDLYYLENWSLWLDLKIIFMTFFNRAAWKNAM